MPLKVKYMSSITSDPIFQIVTTTFFTLLGTAGLTYYFYRKQKKDNDRPEVHYRLKLTSDRLTLIQTKMKPIRNFKLRTLTLKYRRAWRISTQGPGPAYREVPISIPKHLYNAKSFKIKIQYQYREHKYTDILTIFPSDEKYILH